MKKISSKYITFALIVIIVLGGSAYLIYNLTKEKPVINTVEVSKEIKEWGYTLDDRDTELMKAEFEILNTNLTSNEIDYELYASSIAKLFIIDLYTLNNKINASDIPCLEYIYPETEGSFKNGLISTMYRSIEDNSDKKRKQKLPVVSAVDLKELKEVEYKVKDKALPGYEIKLTWDYQEDLGYDQESTITLVKVDKKLYVAKHSVEESQKK